MLKKAPFYGKGQMMVASDHSLNSGSSFSGKKGLLVQVASKYLRLERLHRLCGFIGGK